MRKGLVLSFLLAAAATPLFAGLTFGLSWFSHDSSVKSTRVDIVYHVKLANGETLRPGKYKMEIPLNTQTPELKFFRGGKLIASVPARVKTEARKAPTTEVDYNHEGGAHYMTEVRPAGMNEALVLSETGGMRSGS